MLDKGHLIGQLLAWMQIVIKEKLVNNQTTDLEVPDGSTAVSRIKGLVPKDAFHSGIDQVLFQNNNFDFVHLLQRSIIGQKIISFSHNSSC